MPLWLQGKFASGNHSLQTLCFSEVSELQEERSIAFKEATGEHGWQGQLRRLCLAQGDPAEGQEVTEI